MRTILLAAPDDFEGWREAARALAMAHVPPSGVTWQVAGEAGDLFGDDGGIPPAPPAAPGAFAVPRAFPALAETVVQHRDPERFALLYALLCRLRERPGLMQDGADPQLRRLELMAREVRRDIHKMHAFLRFREVPDGAGGVRYVAWFEPGHHIVRRGAGFFVRRFTAMDWSILTPDVSIHWDGARLTEGPGATRAAAPDGDPLEETWKAYYAAIFNPARVKIGAMLKEMPRKYWKNMPETALIGELVAGARAREVEMVAKSEAKQAREGAEEAVRAEHRLAPGDNARAAWDALFAEARACTRCPLYGPATQTVFGEGPLDAPLMFVGEQPGDQEDLAGRPFVGPAGQLFDRALGEAGIDRAAAYVSNAVKHFKFVPRGKRRVHSKPDAGEIQACRWWIDRERALIRPPITVALGVTAAHSLFGKAVTIAATRGRPHSLPDGGECWVTVHPSFLLRVPDADQRAEEYARFVEELGQVRARLAALA